MNTDSAHYHHHYHHLEEQIQNDYNAKLLKQIGLYEEASAAATQQIQILKRRFDDNLANQAKMYEGKLAKAMQQQQQKPLPPPEVIPLRVRVSVGSSLTNTVSDGGGSGGDIPFVVPQFSKNPPAGIAAAISYPLSYYPFTLHGHDYFLPAHGIDRPAVQAFLNNVYFEPQTHCAMAKLLHCYPGSMVHAGTFFGDMIPHFSNIIKNVSSTSTTKTTAPDHDHHHHHPYQLYAFEPNTRNYLLAQKAVEANELSNVILVNAALGPFVMQQRIQVEASSANNDKDQSLQQHSGKKTPPKLLGGDSSVSPTTGTQRVPQLTIDMFNITNLSIIALDVQDYEVFVLQGGMRTLKNPATRPRVVALEDADLKRPAAAFMQEYLPEYVFITRMDCLSYFALENVYIEVKTLLQECSSASWWKCKYQFLFL